MTVNLRMIARLDIKGANLIKGIHLEGLRVVGDPHVHAVNYYATGADELVFMDIVASLYQRNNLSEIIKRVADKIYIPITVGGGIRSLDNVSQMMHSGADKVSINTAAIERPQLITEVANRYGSQCMVVGVEAKRVAPGRWEAYTNNGRERTGIDVLEWVKQVADRGAGEIMITSVDQEGTRKGFDIALLQTVCDAVNLPIIASGGFGKVEDLSLSAQTGVSGIAIADALHWGRMSLPFIKAQALQAGLDVRPFSGVPAL